MARHFRVVSDGEWGEICSSNRIPTCRDDWEDFSGNLVRNVVFLYSDTAELKQVADYVEGKRISGDVGVYHLISFRLINTTGIGQDPTGKWPNTATHNGPIDRQIADGKWVRIVCTFQ